MSIAEIALGFTNTLDYEMDWDPLYLQSMCNQAHVCLNDVHEYVSIATMQHLLGSFLYHFQNGTGLGTYVQNDALISELLTGGKSRITLGGTAVRAAQVLDTLHHPTLLHLVSKNPETLRLLPRKAEWVCSRSTVSRFPHLIIQFPENAELCVEGQILKSPASNRVIYTKDEDNAQLLISPAFFEQAIACRMIVLSSFDIIQDRTILIDRLQTVQTGLQKLGKHGMVFYEDAHFSHPDFPPLIWNALLPFISVYSMNEDEFMYYLGKKIDLLSPCEVADGLKTLGQIITVPCLVVHTKYWAIAYGTVAERYRQALATGVSVAGLRYSKGDFWNRSDLAAMSAVPVQPNSLRFMQELARVLPKNAVCIPAYHLEPSTATTIGLGDSFVGGFASACCAL